MKRCLFGVLSALLVTSNAFAADLLPTELIAEASPEVSVFGATGWYLRGDVGYRLSDMRGAKFFQGSNDSEANFTRSDLGNAWITSGGVGYQINQNLRTDLTLDYLGNLKFHGSTDGGGSSFGACQVTCSSRDSASLKAWSLMANAYVDLATYGYVTPYVGAGLGGTYVKWKDLSNTSCDTSGSGNGCDDTVIHGGKGGWRFSYGLTGGASIDVSCNVKADVAYRFLHVGGGEMFGYKENSGPGRDKGFNVHEVRVGARYLFGGCPTAGYAPPVEIPLHQPVYK